MVEKGKGRRRQQKLLTLGPRGWAVVLIALSSLFASIALSLPDGGEYRTIFPSQSSIMRIRMGEAKQKNKRFTLSYSPISLSQISPQLARAVLAAEDSRFFEHEGFDWSEVSNAFISSLRTLSFPRGASTISQQLAKNLYLSESRTPIRKVKELVITRRLERTLSKRRIFELYLNVIEWGPGVFGAKAASRYYFNKDPWSLSISECAFLAAIIPNPKTVFNPKLHPKRVSKRQKLLMKRMNNVQLPKAYYR